MNETLLALYRNSLFRNSFYLILATGVTAGFGFFFWLISTRLYPTADIGVATTLISVMGMIATLSLVGFDSVAVRFLPHAEKRSEIIDTGLVLIGTASLVLGVLFIFGVGFISPHLVFIRESPFVAFAFVAFCIMSSINIFTDAVFLAYRRTEFTLIINAIFSAVKMLLPLAFVPWGAFGIFTAAALGQGIGCALSITTMVWKLEYRLRFSIDLGVVGRTWKYSGGNYLAGLLSLMPMTLLPVLIINHLGPQDAAYFYIVMMIGNLLYVIPQATTRSLFAEGSHDEAALALHARKATRIIAFLLTPAIIVLIAGGRFVLGVFGRGYSTGGLDLLYLIAIAGIAVSAFSILLALLRIKGDPRAIVSVNLMYAASILGLSYALLPLGLVGVGIAFLCGNACAALAGYLIYRWPRDFRRKLRDRVADLKTLFFLKVAYIRARAKRGFIRKVALMYPATYPKTPKGFHQIWRIFDILGYDVTFDQSVVADVAVSFEDATVRTPSPVLDRMRVAYPRVINIDCADISKAKVERVFQEVFGYGMRVDPRTHAGPCVRKSDDNAKHDGRVIECPTEPEPGYIYQKLINNQEGDTVSDIRVLVIKDRIPFVWLRCRSVHYRFDRTDAVVSRETAEVFSEDEVRNILRFCKKFGLDFGELDILRDRDDGRIYIVDVSNTPGSPRPDTQMDRRDYERLMKRMSDDFASAFL
jgi:O-antigen/teichoic acid export membrane protein